MHNKLNCKDSNDIPSIDKIHSLTKEMHLVLVFPEDKVSIEAIDTIIEQLSKQLPDYRVFYAGGRDDTNRITIHPVIKKETIDTNLELIIDAIKDYINLSRLLLKNVTDEKNWNDWELTYEHSPHNRYENQKTGQIVETCDYVFTDFKSIDSYFFGEFIETSKEHLDLAKLIKDTYHDTARILDVVEETGIIQEYLKEKDYNENN